MGAAASSPARVPSSTGPQACNQLGPQESARPAGQSRPDAGGGDEKHTSRLKAAAKDLGPVLDLLAEVDAFQTRIAMAGGRLGGPLLTLPDAAELLREALGADLVGIYAFAKDASCSVLLASDGEASEQLPACVRTAPGASPQASPCLGAPCSFAAADAADAADARCARGLQSLHRASGLRGFVQAVMGPPSAPLGALVVASQEPIEVDAAGGGWWQMWLGAAAAVLLHDMHQPQVASMAALLAAVHQVQDPLPAAGLLLKEAASFMARATNLRVSVRLAVLREGGEEAVVFERPPERGDVSASSLPASSCCPPPPPVLSTVMGLEHTLLGSAIAKAQARFVADCSLYMQSCRDIARDVFGRANEMVASIVVVPLLGESGAPLGGLYFASDAPCCFENVQGPLLGVVHVVSRMLGKRLPSFAAAADKEAAQRQRAASLSSSDRSCSTQSWPQAVAARSASSSGVSLRSGGAPRIHTQAMVQVLQAEVRQGWRRSVDLTSSRAELALEAPLGRGGFGRVFRTRWHTAAAAAKVLPPAADERRAMQGAVEAAVLSMVHHPNVVQLYAALTDMVPVRLRAVSDSGAVFAAAAAPAAKGGEVGAAPAPGARYRRLRAYEDGAEPPCSILVLEYCNLGTLRSALRSGAFHRPLQGGALGVDVGAMTEVLLDVAYALEHLHTLGVVHGDVKCDNVLLKSDSTRRQGFTPKLADFGLAKILAEGADSAPNVDGAGTLSHLAPEMLTPGGAVSPAVDAYAFGVMAWELYMRQHAYQGFAPGAVRDLVCRGARPCFPEGAPEALVSLVADCWAHDPAARPAFADIAARLEALAAWADPRPGA